MVAKFLVIPVFIIKCDKKILDALFRPFRKKLLQSLTNRGNFADNRSDNIFRIFVVLK